MTIRQVIAAKRDGRKHTRQELTLVAQAAAGKADSTDYQLSAWLMAAYLNGLDDEETLWLTLAMAESGERLDLSGLPRPWLDKHSTGGVGDKATLVVLPILAACGLTMVKMSGRGLGITGGTIDKLESIPGFRTDLTPEELIDQAGCIGLAITGQSPNLAPADKTLYALRDTTETVGAMPLIVSSILSKKIAAGADHLVLDVKCGSGAFMKDLASARQLATMLKSVAERSGMKTGVAITDMNQPLGRTVGNALEVLEADRVLRGEQGRFASLCVDLAGEALEVCGTVPSFERGRAAAAEALSGGMAYDKWVDLVRAQGGPDLRVQPIEGVLRVRPVDRDVLATTTGWVSEVRADRIGNAVSQMGGGRRRKEDSIDHSVGVECLVDVGSQVEIGQPILKVYGETPRDTIFEDIVIISETPIPSICPVIERL